MLPFNDGRTGELIDFNNFIHIVFSGFIRTVFHVLSGNFPKRIAMPDLNLSIVFIVNAFSLFCSSCFGINGAAADGKKGDQEYG